VAGRGVTGPLRCPCDGRFLELAWRYDGRPEGETDFGIEDYRRDVHRCGACGHYVSRHELGDIYAGGYVDSTYGDRMRATFDRIMALPPEASDNAGRVERLLAFAGPQPRTVLDVGSGLCVFLARLVERGWSGTALDPDPRAAAHARDVVGAEAVCGDYMTVPGLGRYDVVTFNKVLEHVDDPVAMLARSRDHVRAGGLVYVEVPDGDAAAAEGPGREEFFIEHVHVFSPASLALTATRAGYSPLRVDRLREPSSKYTLAAFLAPA
jgi:SAM-dependent methyltransferase